MKVRTILIVAATWACFGWILPQAQAQTSGQLVYHIVIKNGRFEPSRLEVPAGAKIKLTIQNAGNGPIEFENLDLRVEKVLAPGASSFLVLRPLRPGSYRFIDDFHPSSEMVIVAK